MSDFECIHCGEIDYCSNHWEACKKHPARKIINELVDEIKQLEDEAANWHNLKPIYNDCEKEVKELDQKILELQGENKQLKNELKRHTDWYDSIADDIPADLGGKSYGVAEWYNIVKSQRDQALKQIESLKNELDLAYKMHDVAVKERDYERSLVKALMAELNRKS